MPQCSAYRLPGSLDSSLQTIGCYVNMLTVNRLVFGPAMACQHLSMQGRHCMNISHIQAAMQTSPCMICTPQGPLNCRSASKRNVWPISLATPAVEV